MRFLLFLYMGIYAAITMGFGIIEAFRNGDLSLVFGFPLALWTMHLAWGSAFLTSMLGWILRRIRGGS
jgi:hypothetical protein